MIKYLMLIGIITLISCTSKPKQTENKVSDMDFLSDTVVTENEKLFDFYYKFSSDNSYQLERTEFPLLVQKNNQNTTIDKSGWSHDYLFVNLEYITQIFSSYTKTFDYNEDIGEKAIFSWIYPDKQEEKDYYFQRTNGKWFLKKIAINDLNLNSPENFISFLKQFMSDSVFQMSRIKFPLEYKTLYDSDEESFLDTTFILNQTDWRYNNLYSGLQQMTNFSYSWSPEIKESNEMLLFVSGVENGIFIQYFFKKTDGKWYLIKKNDEST